MNISDEAVEVAEEYLSLLMSDPRGDYTMEARTLLEAAAPHMLTHLTRALGEATQEVIRLRAKAGSAEAQGALDLTNPYRRQA